ncbi:hypothetical protein GCM10009600_33290 [Oerskovia paurometabola]
MRAFVGDSTMTSLRPEDIRSCFPLLLVWLAPGAVSGWAEVLGVGYGVGQGRGAGPHRLVPTGSL